LAAEAREVGGASDALDLPEERVLRERVAVEHSVDPRQQLLRRPRRVGKRMVLELPREILVEGTDPPLGGEDRGERGRHRLGYVKTGSVATRAIGRVDIRAERLAQDPAAMLVRDPFLRRDDAPHLAAGAIEQRLDVRVQVAPPLRAATEFRLLARPFEGRARDLDRRPVLVRPDRVEAPQRVLVAQDDRHVVVGALVDEEAAPARPEHEQPTISSVASACAMSSRNRRSRPSLTPTAAGSTHRRA